MTNKFRKIVDWEAMRPDWMAGVKSVLQLSEEYGVSRAAILKHWGKEGLERDLAGNIKAKAALVKGSPDLFDKSGFVYVIYIDDSSKNRYYKIGMASGFSSRFSNHQCASPFDICVACVYYVNNMRLEERILHELYADKRVKGEWFQLDMDDLIAISARSLLI